MRWRVAMRLARREVTRRPGRTVLVVLLVAIPVAGMTLSVVLNRTDELTAEEEFRSQHGDADAVGHGLATRDSGGSPVDLLGGTLGGLPAGASSVDIRSTSLLIGDARFPRDHADVTDAPFDGRYRLLEGRKPAPGEAVLTRHAASVTDAGIGDDVTIGTADAYRAGAGRRHEPDRQVLTVVGLAEDAQCLDCTRVMVHRDHPLPGTVSVTRLADLPEDLSEGEAQALVAEGWELAPAVADGRVTGLDVVPADSQRAEIVWTVVIGAVVLTAAGIVIAAAFAVSARRQLTTLGQLSAVGASPALVRRMLALQGTVSGLLGLAAGWVLAAVVLGVGRGVFEQWLGHRLPAWDVRPGDMVAIAAVAVAAATIAALLPARTAARIPTLAALAGRRPVGSVPRSLTVGGLAAIGTGLGFTALAMIGGTTGDGTGTGGDTQVWAAVGVVGGVLQLLGAAAITPMLASGLEPVARRLRGSWRLGTRSLARHRARTGAVVAAVAVTAGLAVFAGGMVRGFQARDESGSSSPPRPPDRVAVAWQEAFAEREATPPAPADTGDDGGLPVQDAVVEQPARQPTPPDTATVATIGQILPDATRVVVRQAVHDPADARFWQIAGEGVPWSTTPAPIVADPAVLDVFELGDGVRQRVADEGLVWVPSFASDEEFETVTVTLPDGRERTAAVDTSPASRPARLPSELGELVISTELVESLDLTALDRAMAFQSLEPLTERQRFALESLTTAAPGAGIAGTTIAFAHPESAVPGRVIETVLAGVATAVALMVIGTSLALSAAEGRDERELLSVTGAKPRDLASAAGVRAGALAVLGAALAIPLGLAPVAVISWAEDDLPIRVPWLTLALLVLAAPALAALTAQAASAVAQRVRPIRISTAAFE